MRLVQVGAYLELQFDGSYPPDDGSLESNVLESIDNLEALALNNGLCFVWDEDSKAYTLDKLLIEREGDDPEAGMESRLAAQEQQYIEDKQYYSPEGLHEDG